MARNEQALKVALAAAKQLPRVLQRRLAEQLLATAARDQETTVVSLQRLSSKNELRLTKLIEKRAESPLRRSEQQELKQLGVEIEQMLLANSQPLALRPELFLDTCFRRYDTIRTVIPVETGIQRDEAGVLTTYSRQFCYTFLGPLP